MEDVVGGQWSLASQGRVLCQQYIITRSLRAGAQLKKIRCDYLHLWRSDIKRDVDNGILQNPPTCSHSGPKSKPTLNIYHWSYLWNSGEDVYLPACWHAYLQVFSPCLSSNDSRIPFRPQSIFWYRVRNKFLQTTGFTSEQQQVLWLFSYYRPSWSIDSITE